ncbi:N4-gp56 family major capsid protein [Paradevosia shaoguanensis]|uniref:N4-gp56 family major capsid protein n=1 Tax=Paradevosia shaoguanensis TaxID=1335043 RepID=UPI001931531C|nr:N4-gp56 family major capsid protein [Paradevosia shaoguanensis]
MAVHTIGVNDALAVKLWSNRMDVEALKETTAYEFMGTGAGSLCQIMTETQKGAGDSIKWGIRMLAQGEGTTENETQEGNEEGITRYSDTLVINELGHAHRVRNEGTIDRQRVPYDMREECYDSLKDWTADRVDTWFFNQLAGNTAEARSKYTGFNSAIAPSSTRVFRSKASATDQAAGADTTAVFKLAMIDSAVNRAKTTSPMLRPIKGLGKDVDYVCFIHPDQTLSLRADTATAGNWFDLQGKRLQGGEGDRNGLYTGALGIYNRTLIVENTRVPQGVHSTSGASVANTRRAIFCGAQSASIAFGKGGGKNKFKWVEDLFDYDRELGARISFIAGLKKTVYNSVDYGTIVLTSYAAPAA